MRDAADQQPSKRRVTACSDDDRVGLRVARGIGDHVSRPADAGLLHLQFGRDTLL